MRKKIQKQLPLMETASGHTQEIELDIISSIIDNTPTISDYVLQDLTKGKTIRFFSELVVVKKGKKSGLSIKTEWTSGIS